jgi:predicted DNA-binding protein (UPF0251 family)
MPSTRVVWESDTVTLKYVYTEGHREHQIFVNGVRIEKVPSARRRRIIARTALISRFGELEIECPPDKIPTEIAVDGKPAIASYLYGIHELRKEEIAATMDISKSTVKKYLRRFRNAEKKGYPY